MAVSVCSRRLACTRRYVPADLKQRWLRQLQWATRKVCWGRKASCQEDFENRLWLFLPDHLSTPCSVLRWRKILCLLLWNSLGSIQGAVATLPYWNQAGKNFSIKRKLGMIEKCSVPKSCLVLLSDVDHPFFCLAVSLSVCLPVFFCWITCRMEMGRQVLFKCLGLSEKP